MLKIAVCDDNREMLSYISQVITEYFTENQTAFRVFSYSNGKLLLSDHQEEKYDVVFLDIQMPEIDGFEIANEMRKQSSNLVVIFITSNDSLVFKSLDYQPFHFICKGNGGRIERDIVRVLTAMNEHMKRFSVITLKMAYQETAKIMISNLLYIESDGHYLRYYIKGGEFLRVRGEMQEAQNQMEIYGFIRTHRKFLVNPYCISKLSSANGTVRLTDGKTLEIGRNYKEIVFKKYGHFCSNNL